VKNAEKTKKELIAELNRLRLKVVKLEKAKSGITPAKRSGKRIDTDLKERIKELNCFYALSELYARPEITIPEILQETTRIVASAWQYPEVTCARIIFNDKEFKTKNCKKTRWKQGSDIKIDNKRIGEIAVYYLEKRPQRDEGPFLKEERRLIDAIAERLGKVIQRKRAEKNFREYQEQLTIISENINDVIFQLDRSGKVSYISPNVHALYGYRPRELVGKHFSTTTPKDQMPRAEEAMREVLAGKETWNLELKQRNSAGKTIPMELNITPIKKGGKVVAILGVMRDITKRKKAEEALRESEERFRNLMEFIPGISIQGYHTDGTVFYWNRASELVYGYKAEEAIGKNLGDLIIPKKLKPLFRNSLKLANKLKQSGEFMPPGELDLLRKDGKSVSVYSIHTAVHRPGKEPLLFCIDVDLSERKEAEEALRESEERYRSLFEIAPVGIFLLDMRGNIVAANEKGSSIYGYSIEKILKRRVSDIVPKDISGNFPSLVKNVKKEGLLFFESRGKKKNGRAFPVELSVSLFRWKGQEYLQVLVNDITEQKQAEEAEHLKKLSDALMRFQEEERKRIARELHDHVGQDLATIKIGLAMIKRSYPDLEKDIVEEIDESILTAEKIINDVRRISSELRPESLDRIGLVPSLEHATAYLSERSGVEIELKCVGMNKRLEPDHEITIYRIIQEALTNVIKHARAGKAKVKLERKGDAIRLKIKDDGRGFSPEREKKRGGLGLLGIRERAVSAGGNFQIKSSPGKGTTLSISLPLRTLGKK